MFSFKNALVAQSFSQRPRHDLGTDGKKLMKFCEFFFSIYKINKVNLKEISEPQNIDHTTQSGQHTFLLVLAMVFGEMNFVT